jgi:FkbM family methyltransferase
MPLLPSPPDSFIGNVPTGGKIRLAYRDAIGLSQFIYGSFERAEIDFLQRNVRPDSIVIDVGANVGYFTVALAQIVKEGGRVIACEPEPDNLKRLRENLALNRLHNVEVVPTAVGEYDGMTTLYLGDESVYHTTAVGGERLPITATHETGDALSVRLAKLDTLWKERGCPEVSFMKIDVEGTELNVFKGALGLLKSRRPTLVVETEHFDDVSRILAEFGYELHQPPGFFVSNFVFTAA